MPAGGDHRTNRCLEEKSREVITGRKKKRSVKRAWSLSPCFNLVSLLFSAVFFCSFLRRFRGLSSDARHIATAP
jgi:hypothetical protein